MMKILNAGNQIPVPSVLRIRDFYPGSRIMIFTHPGSRIRIRNTYSSGSGTVINYSPGSGASKVRN